MVACQEERSQVQNREKCMRMLASKLYEIEAGAGQRRDLRPCARSQVGTGMRNERIRTYNFPQGRVTDHRIGLTLYKIDAIMDGELGRAHGRPGHSRSGGKAAKAVEIEEYNHMKTILLDARRPRKPPAVAAELIRRGRLVAIPTETVYGLGRRWAESGGGGQNL